MARLVAVVVVAVLVLSACSDGSSSSPSAAANGPAGRTTTVDGSFRCPDPEAEPHGDGGSDRLPTGATAARLCLHDNRSPWSPPNGILATGLDALVSKVDSQRIYDPSSQLGCGGVGAPAWTIVLRYPSGTRTISGDNGGCWDLLVGSTQRFGSRHVFQAYLRALLHQRQVQGSPDTVWQPPACPRRRSAADPALAYPAVSPAAATSRVVAATWCRRDGSHWTSAGPATRAQLALLRRDITTAEGRTGDGALDHCRDVPSSPETLLVGRDPWGDLLAVDFSCDTYRLLTPPRPRAEFVTMLPSTTVMVASVDAD